MPSLPIILPEEYVPLVVPTDTVTVGQILAKKEPQKEFALNIPVELNVPIRKAKSFIKKKPGETVTKGDVLAERKNFWGKAQMRVVSTSNGKVTRFERETGTMFIESDEQITEAEEIIISPIEGTIALCNNGKILIETDKNVLIGTDGLGGQGTEELLILGDSETVELYHLRADMIGKVIFGGYFPRDVLVKAVSMGLVGVVSTRIEEADFAYLREKNISVPVLQITLEDARKMAKWQGKHVFVNGEGKFVILLHNKN